jgi:hypothetical protein
LKLGHEIYSDELAAEILPLARRSWKESTTAKGETCAYYGERDFEIEPDTDQYRRMYESGMLTIVTLRDEGKLVGYLIAATYRSLHHRKMICAHVDTLYVDPEHRAYTPVMIEGFENLMKVKEVDIVGWPTHVKGPVYELLTSLGYVGDDLVMEKRLRRDETCVSSVQ